MTAGAVVAGLLGLWFGNLINWLVDRQAVTERHPPPPARSLHHWLPVWGAVSRRDWFGLVVELLTAVTVALLYVRYGLTLRFALLLAAALLLIDTGAVDWRVKLIDVLVLLVATLIAVVTANLRGLDWSRSLLGLLTGLILFMLFFVLAKILYPGQVAPFGLGDVYLGAFIGALVGFFDLPRTLFYGMALAAIVSVGLILVLGYKRARYIPISYGSYLCLGALIQLVQG